MIRQGDWKYIYYAAGYPAQLFNLAEDLGEQKILAVSIPDMVSSSMLCKLDPEAVDKAAKKFDKNSFSTF